MTTPADTRCILDLNIFFTYKKKDFQEYVDN